MLFCACRAADLLNAFVGLWLVPKYVDPSELGAVMPLTQFANFLAIPVAAFANTFRNELTRLSINKEFGKLKTLMRGVFVATAVFLFVAIVVARFTLPLFLERIRIVEGSLGLVIIVRLCRRANLLQCTPGAQEVQGAVYSQHRRRTCAPHSDAYRNALPRHHRLLRRPSRSPGLQHSRLGPRTPQGTFRQGRAVLDKRCHPPIFKALCNFCDNWNSRWLLSPCRGHRLASTPPRS